MVALGGILLATGWRIHTFPRQAELDGKPKLLALL